MDINFVVASLISCVVIQIRVSSGQWPAHKCEFNPKDLNCNCSCRDGRDGREGRDGKDGRDLTCQDSSLRKEIELLQARLQDLESRMQKLSPLSPNGNKFQNYKEAIIPNERVSANRAAESEIFHGGQGNDPHMTNLHKLPYEKQQEMLDLLDKMGPTQKPKKPTYRPTIPEILDSIKDNVPQLDREGKIPQKFLPAGFDTFGASDLQWQSLHMSAAASCRGLTKNGGHPGIHSVVLLRNSKERKTCREICAKSWADKCEAEVSIWGMPGKGKSNGQEVGNFYNYGCDYGGNGGNEASVDRDAILKPLREAHQYYFSYCCCSFY